MAAPRVPSAAIDIIRSSEGLRLRAYRDPGGVWTIGYGHTGPVDGRPVAQGMTISPETADALLAADVRAFATGVAKEVPPNIGANRFGALVSLAYNIGIGAFRASSMLAAVGRADWQTASKSFARYNRAGGQVLKGLSYRRARERALFDTPDAGA